MPKFELTSGQGVLRSKRKFGPKSPDLRGEIILPDNVHPGMRLRLVGWLRTYETRVLITLRVDKSEEQWPKEVKGAGDVPL